jgi:hypothetical protein
MRLTLPPAGGYPAEACLPHGRVRVVRHDQPDDLTD